ncbi:DUF262 domain-containing protein [Sulfurovum mangrovi]|uniref:DUF262 domain-containing protein n=1 Tax=Sulfurovum mangrovi TaxID=2893889 RepID=UPI001E655EC6|nr:DUF262 domain-containing protein [Sulfurovum mangrovi]UFH60564.1 DUF262 domain-containing protein [Sulfurovum mangrovi]
MNEILQRTTNTIQIAEFWENFQLNKYNFDPAYQRYSVWSEEKQSFFIDSILRNYPVPPIFLHKKIDDATGKQSFDVIDGKQRLTSIIRFINNEIPATSETDNEGDELAGLYFKDLDKEALHYFKKAFWRYELQIQYVDTEDKELIDKLFDRLNRNGEALNGQELRHSQYHNSLLLKTVTDLAEMHILERGTKHYDLARMEDKEFISELLFAVIEKKPLGADKQDIIDNYYKKLYNEKDLIEPAKKDFIDITSYLEALHIDYEKYSIKGVSHIYGLWCFAQECYKKKEDIEFVSKKLDDFYTELKNLSQTSEPNKYVELYKKSMSAGTKSQSQRTRRLDALSSYVF